jgi:hypothetical protein
MDSASTNSWGVFPPSRNLGVKVSGFALATKKSRLPYKMMRASDESSSATSDTLRQCLCCATLTLDGGMLPVPHTRAYSDAPSAAD